MPFQKVKYKKKKEKSQLVRNKEEHLLGHRKPVVEVEVKLGVEQEVEVKLRVEQEVKVDRLQ
jgi:hypothetical protein